MMSTGTKFRARRRFAAAMLALLAAGVSSCEEDLFELPPAEQTDLAFVRHLFSGGQPDHPAWSPDGEQLAFIAKRTGRSQIYVGDERGNDAVAITTEAGSNSSPSWSPDGTWIAFATIRTGHWDIWRVAVDGSFEEPLTNDPDEDRDPAVGPDGAIVFASVRGTGSGGERSFNLWLLDAPGADPVRLTLSDGDDLGPAWSPDGREIVFHRFTRESSELWVLDRATTRVRRLTSNQLALDQDPAWSLDGRFVAFASTRDGSWDLWITAADASSGVPRQLTDTDWNDRRPRWSADPRAEDASLVFASDRDSEAGIWVAWGLIR